MRITASYALLERLAEEQRRVLSGWRALVLLRRATYSVPPHERRWEQLPHDVSDLTPLFRQMQRRGEIRPFAQIARLYQVTVPYAEQGPIDEREVLFELHPYAALSHLSALAFHGLTDELPKSLTASYSADTRGGLIPIGTQPSDWEGLAKPGVRRPDQVFGQPVKWVRIKPERFFGLAEYQPFGFPVRYTTLERTLIDCLQNPELGGGIANTMHAWVLARDRIDIDALVYDTDRFDIGILRQRVGFVMEQLGLNHSKLAEWRKNSKRGGSSRLVGAEPFASQFDENWNLSLNGPIHLLRDERT